MTADSSLPDAQSDSLLLVLITAPREKDAEALADLLVGGRFAACVNIVRGISSVFHWQGAIERAEEVLLIVKTTRERYPALEAAVVSAHPYEVPEVIALPLAAGFAAYCTWAAEAVKNAEAKER